MLGEMPQHIDYASGLSSEEFREYGCRRGPVGVFAIHGGGIEPGTEQLARYLVENTLASAYVFSGRRGKRNIALHLPSYRFVRLGSALLKQILSDVQTVLSLHGHNRADRDIYLAGTNLDLLHAVIRALASYLPAYKVSEDPALVDRRLRALDSRNLVNLPPHGGVQIELPRSLRQAMKTRGWQRHEHSVLYGDTLLVGNALRDSILEWQSRFQPS